MTHPQGIRVLTLLAALALSAMAAAPQEQCAPGDRECLARIVDRFVQEAPREEELLRDEAIESGHLYILDVAGKQVQVILRDPQDHREPFIVLLPAEWRPILEGTEPANPGEIVAAVRQGFDRLVARIRALNRSGEPVARDTRHFPALDGSITERYLDELLALLSGSGASAEVKAAGERLKAAADARLAAEPSPYADVGGDQAEAEDVRAIFDYLEAIEMVFFG